MGSQLEGMQPTVEGKAWQLATAEWQVCAARNRKREDRKCDHAVKPQDPSPTSHVHPSQTETQGEKVSLSGMLHLQTTIEINTI